MSLRSTGRQLPSAPTSLGGAHSRGGQFHAFEHVRHIGIYRLPVDREQSNV